MNFRELVKSKAAAADPCERPRTMEEVAGECGVTRAHLYNLMGGRKVARPWTVAKIARGLGVAVPKVQRALDKTYAECLEC